MHAVAPLVVAVASFVEVVMRFVVRQHADAPHFVPFVIVVVVAVGVVAFVLHVLAFVVVESRLVLAVMRKCMIEKGSVVWFYMIDQELVLFEVNRVGLSLSQDLYVEIMSEERAHERVWTTGYI